MSCESWDFEETIEGLRDNLLDMSLRNNLLNFRSRRKCIEIVDEDIASLYKILVIDEEKMKFLSNEDLDEDILSENNTWDSNSKLKDTYLDRFLQTKHESDELQKRLTQLYRDNKTTYEEQGYNDFFLALGFLEWKEIDHSEGIHKAPLVLVPMSIERSSISQPFTVRWNGDEVRSNLSLIYKLKEQGVEIPDFEEFDSQDDLINYFKEIESLISQKDGWKITNDIFLSSFNFKKFVMFKDLDLSNWNGIKDNAIKSLFNPDSSEYGSDDVLDLNSLNSTEIFNVMDADSSQLAVLEEAKNGKNLVVEGPPGTGKSQTIVNLIAELMATGKRILFVSEKKAALDVVKSRLDSVGLGEGCLELHGKNSNKKEFLNELERTLNIDSVKLSDENDFRKLDDVKAQLDEYVEVLHTPYASTQLTPFRLIGMYEYQTQKLTDNNQEIIKLDIDDVSQLDTEKRGEIIIKLNEIKGYYDIVSPVNGNLWRNTSPENLSSPEVKQLEDQLHDMSTSLEKFDKCNDSICELIGTDKLNTLNIDLLLNNSKVLKPDLKLLKDEDYLEGIIRNIENFQNKIGNINIDVLNLDLNSLKNEIDTLLENINNLNINMDIMDKEDFKSINEAFKTNKNIIEESNLEDALKNPNLEAEFYEFKTKRSSFIKRIFSGEFKRIRNNFKSYYNFDVSDDQIEADFEKLIAANNDLTKLRNTILAYSKSETDNDDKIRIESEKLISWASELDNIKSKLSSYHVTIQSNALNDKINTLIKLKELLEAIESFDDIGKYYFGDSWKSYNSDINVLNKKLIDINEFRKLYDSKYFNDITVKFIESNQFDTLNSYLDELSSLKEVIIKQYRQIDDKLHFKDELKIDNIDTTDVSSMKNTIDILLENIEGLTDYRLFAKYCNEYSDEYTKDLIKYIKQDKVKPELIDSLFYYNFVNIALFDIFSNEPVLDEFNSKLHEEKLAEFKKLDKAIIESNKYRVREVLGNNRPNIAISTGNNTALGILMHEMTKKRKIKPIRKILSETSDIISSIKPCFMMSPLSIAQYLDPNVYESYFDYVIFDEASQVKIEDSIGAMMRGNRYVVMGDTKQLPPTTFFEKELDIDDDEEDEGFADNIESILHLCKNSFKTRMLRWHYRSRHESLISVSNQEFYNNDLYVFPSPTKKSDDLGLKFKYDPNTVYARGDGSNNIKEAENVVEYAFDCFRKWGNSRSLGIGTFNLKQRNTIMDIIEEKLKDNPEFEQFFNEDGEEGFFVKNLENIQGDERDIILISLGYGRDQNNKLSLSFGPLNKEGGERRLNVLITRAKRQCVVFSNFKSSEMHTTQSTPRGVEALKTFLYYAENGEFPENYHTGGDFDSPFEESVYNFLTDEGYVVEKQVGCAGYKIDLAIVDKDDANRYVLAIECDGATYHSSQLARDRDRLRQEVLEGLGWKFHRIWSTDWYHINQKAKKRLLYAVEEAMKNKDNEKIAREHEDNLISKPEPKAKIITKTIEDKKQEELGKYFKDYETYEFDEYAYPSNPSDNIVELVKIEEPICVDDIYDVMKVMMDRRATKKFKSEIDKYIKSCVKKASIKKEGDFYMLPDSTFDDMKVRRRKSPKIERIYPRELENSIIYSLKLEFSSPRDDLIKTASTYLGFKALRSNVKDKLNMVVDDLISQGVIKEESGKLELVK